MKYIIITDHVLDNIKGLELTMKETGKSVNSYVISTDPNSSSNFHRILSGVDEDTIVISFRKSATDTIYQYNTNYPEYQILSSGNVNGFNIQFMQINSNDLDYEIKLFTALTPSKVGSLEDPKLSRFSINTAYNYEEFYKYYVENLEGKDTISYDIETNSGSVYGVDSKVIGFSLCSRNSRSGIYVLLNSTDYNMDNDNRIKCEELLLSILMNTKTIVIQNLAFEVPQTRTWLDYEIPYEKIEDTMVQSRMRVHRGIGLKNQVMLNLGMKDWSEDLHNLMDNIAPLLDTDSNGGLFYIYKTLNPKQTISISELKKFKNFSELSFMSKVIPPKTTKKFDNLYNNLLTVIDVLDKYEAQDSYYSYYINQLMELEVSTKKRGAYFYDLPSSMISKYGALDAILTMELYEYNLLELKSDSNKYGIDVFRGYRVFMRHAYLASIFSSNGLYWDEDRVLFYEDVVMKEGKEALVNLLKLEIPYLMVELRNNLKQKMMEYDKNHRGDKLMTALLSLPNYISISQEGVLKLSTVNSSGKITKRSYDINTKLPELYEFLDDKYKEDLFIEYLPYYFDEVISHPDYSLFDIMSDINMNSPVVGKTVVQHFITDNMDEFVVGHIYNTLPAQIEALESILKGESSKPVDPVLHNQYQNSINILVNTNFLGVLKELSDCSNREGVARLYDSYRLYLKDIYPQLTKDIEDRVKYNMLNKNTNITDKLNPKYWNNQCIIDDPQELQLGPDEESLIYLYEVFTKGTSIDPDDESTWDYRYKFLHYFRYFKKCFKIKSTYIDGTSLGRSSVSIVNKKELQDGKVVKRLSSYKPKDQLLENETYLSTVKFSPFSAATGRWTSGMHTVPWRSPAREFYGSRYLGGIVIAPDYSQAEIRVLAASSQEDNLLKAYAEGIDVHMMTAKGIFGDNPSESQRRFSKMGTFRILYGGSAKGFADQNLSGNVELANRIYEGFYETYPKVKDWVAKKHREVRDTGVVTLMTGRYIRIPRQDYEKKMLNQAQNFPIQGASSDMTADVMFMMYKYLRDNGLKSKPFCFVHDSLELDIHPNEIFSFIPVATKIMNEYPRDEYGVPMKAEMVFGKSMGEEIEVVEIDPETRSITCEGYQDEIDRVLSEWRVVFDSVEVEVLSSEDKFITMKELWVHKKSYDSHLGKSRVMSKLRITLGNYIGS